MEDVFQGLDKKRLLDREFSKKEIKDTLFQMNPNKAPSPDGMNVCF